MLYLRNNLFFLVISILLWNAAIPAWAEDAPASATRQEREGFARNFAQTVINIIRDPRTSYGNRRDILRRSFSSSVDIDWIAKFVLGRPWKDATDKQREIFVSLYRKFLTETYIARFAENPDNGIYDIKITGVNDEPDNAFTVHTRMQLMNRENLKVDYLVGDSGKHYKVMDIVIENVSLIASHRAQFSELAEAQGIEGVITQLRQRLGQGGEIKLSRK
jgi:phospholipid transport system substrate-binding protein